MHTTILTCEVIFVKIAKGLMLMSVGAAMVLLYQRYGYEMMIMAEDMIENKRKCLCDELED